MANDTGTAVELEIVCGEDFACQMFWTDEYGEPVPVSDPALMDVKDANGQIAIRFSDTADSDTEPKLTLGGANGYFQLTCPREVTQKIPPGRYVFDLFASVADSSVFGRQMQQVIGGWVSMLPRVTRIEGAGDAVIDSEESP